MKVLGFHFFGFREEIFDVKLRDKSVIVTLLLW